MIREILRQIEPSITSAISLSALLPQMTVPEQDLIEDFIRGVIDNTSILDLNEKEALNYMKLYLKFRKAPEIQLGDLISEQQKRRLEQL